MAERQADGIVRESASLYVTPISLVKKRACEMRLCVDYRGFNAKTLKDKYPLPRIGDQLEASFNSSFY